MLTSLKLVEIYSQTNKMLSLLVVTNDCLQYGDMYINSAATFIKEFKS